MPQLSLDPSMRLRLANQDALRLRIANIDVWDYEGGAPEPDNGPYTAYNFEESGSQFLDVSGNGHHATINPAINRTESFSKNGTHAAKQGAVIAGGTSGVSVAGYNAMLDRTVAGWVSYYQLVGTWLMRWQSQTADSGVYGLYYAAGAFIARVKKGGVNYQASYSITPVVNTWYHVAQTYDGTTGALLLYVNGVQQASATVTGGGLPDAADFIDLAGDGSTPGSDTTSGLAVDDWQTWPRVLTSAEINTAMNTPV